MQTQRVAHVIESQGVRQLRIDQTDHVTLGEGKRGLLTSTACSRAAVAPGGLGIKLQSCRSRENVVRVGLR